MTGEVDGVAWQPLPLTDLLTGLAPGARHVVAVDGHGASGKSTLAHRLAAVAGRPAAVVHTDDVAWHHSFFDWADLLAGGVLDPFRAGEPVRFRPPAWERRGRAGAIVVPDGTELLLVEGTGVGRRSLAAAVDLLLWVHVDPAVARERGLARDLAAGENGGTPESVARFWDEWMAEEDPFLERERPWERAAWLVHGNPTTPLPPDQVLAAGRFRSNPDLVEDPEQPELRRGSGTTRTS